METLSGGPRFQKIDAATLTADANIREGPSTNTPLVGMIPSGAQLTVTGRMEDYDWHYDWYQVRLRDGTTGYFLGKLIPPEGAWLLAPAHTVPPDVPPVISPDVPAIVTDPPTTETGKGVPHPSIPPAWQERRTESGLGATSAPLMPLMISVGALAVSLLGFLSTTVMTWRVDRRAMRAEARAQEEHGWKKADRVTSDGNRG
jgi:hypothetical protein